MTPNKATIKKFTPDHQHHHKHHTTSYCSKKRTKWLYLSLVLSAVGILNQMVELAEYNESRLHKKWPSASTIIISRSATRPTTARSALVMNSNNDKTTTRDKPAPLGLFAPSLTYQIKSEDNNNNDIQKKSCHAKTERNVTWEWNRYSSNHSSHVNSTSTTTTRNRKVLIGMYAGFDQYARLLRHTALVNKAYAKKWGYDLVVLQGGALEHPEHCMESGRSVTLNKIRLLFHAIDHQQEYDQLLLLDADALIVDLDTELTTLLSTPIMVAAHQVTQTTKTTAAPHPPPQAWNINAGVMLWNVHHPLTRGTAVEWFQKARQGVLNDKFRGDQRYLQTTLRNSDERMAAVQGLTTEFAYGHGTVVKHFIRERMHKNWKDPEILAHREGRIRLAAEQVCAQYAGVCDKIEEVIYPTA